MGGFAGGDEAGYWDEETLSLSDTPNASRLEKPSIKQTGSAYSMNAYAKHEFPESNRWVRANELYDTIHFIPSPCSIFTIESEDLSDHSLIPLAYEALIDATHDPEIEDFFVNHKIVISHIGLAGSSSHTAAFLHMTKELCNLILSTDELAKIGRNIAPDMPFFIYNYSSATISDSGEIIGID